MPEIKKRLKDINLFGILKMFFNFVTVINQTLLIMKASLKRPYTVRIVCIGCMDSLGQKNRTFTKDEEGKINSPSFDSYYDFCNWKNQAYLYSLRVDLQMTKRDFKAPLN